MLYGAEKCGTVQRNKIAISHIEYLEFLISELSMSSKLIDRKQTDLKNNNEIQE